MSENDPVVKGNIQTKRRRRSVESELEGELAVDFTAL
jgi:hypothetical protein